MIKKLSRHGNSRALLIEKPILDILGWSGDQEVEITTDGKNLFVKPAKHDAKLNLQAFKSYVTNNLELI